MKTVIFGGTFNPIHLGHLYVIHSLATKTDYERIIIIPTFDPPHKSYDKDISDTDRLELIHKGIEDYRTMYVDDRSVDIIVDTVELDRGGKSYMYDTVLEVYKKYEITGNLGVAVGDDLLSTLEDWYRAEDLFPIVHFVIINRFDQEIGNIPEPIQGEYIFVEPVVCSSSTIRDMLGSPKSSLHSLSFLLSESVLDYIIDYELYQRH